MLLGGITDEVVRTSHLPTLTINGLVTERHPQNGDAFASIIVPLDGTRLAERALPYATELGKRLSLPIVVLRVVDTGGPYSDLLDDTDGHGLAPEVEGAATKYLKEAAENLAAEGLKVTWKLLAGPPGQRIVEFASQRPQGMIVMATHVRSGLSRWAKGSVAETLVRSHGGLLLMVPPPAGELQALAPGAGEDKGVKYDRLGAIGKGGASWQLKPRSALTEARSSPGWTKGRRPFGATIRPSWE